MNLENIIITGKDKDADQFVSFNVASKRFDPYTGEPVEDEVVVVDVAQINQEIASLQAEIENKQALLEKCLAY